MNLKTKTILITLLFGIFLIGSQWYIKEKDSSLEITDDYFLKIFDKPEEIKIWAKGDINNDGFEDAVVAQTSCGASCGTKLLIILNEQNRSGKILDPDNENVFKPVYLVSGATKSELTGVVIQNGTVRLSGFGLLCVQNESGVCSEDDWRQQKTVLFKLDGSKMVQISN